MDLPPSVSVLSPSALPLAPSSVAAAPSQAPVAPTAPPAPPEAIALDLASVKSAFQGVQARFLDLSGRFSFDERARISSAVNELSQKTGSKVWVLALPGKTDVNTYAPIHAELKMQKSDVLLIFSAERRHLHSQAIPKSTGNDILKETNTAFYKSSPVEGVLETLDAVTTRLAPATAATTQTTATPAAPQPSTPRAPTIPIDWLLIAAAAAVIVWMLLKGRKTPQPRRAPTSNHAERTNLAKRDEEREP